MAVALHVMEWSVVMINRPLLHLLLLEVLVGKVPPPLLLLLLCIKKTNIAPSLTSRAILRISAGGTTFI